MDERAASMLGQGNSILHQGEATQRTLAGNIGRIKKGYENLNSRARADRTTAHEEDIGLDAKDGFTAMGDISRMGASLQRASARYTLGGKKASALAGLKGGGAGDLGTIADVSDMDRLPTSALGTAKTFVSPSFQASEMAGAGTKAIQTVKDIGATGEATQQAASGLPRMFQQIAKVGGESGKSAAAIGDVVGHGLGLTMAGIGIAKDVSGGWSTMDADQKKSNVLGIAGGIVDAVSMAIPIFTPLAIGLNIASGVEGYLGDQDAPKEEAKRNKLKQAKEVSQQETEMKLVAPTSTASTGQVAMKTQSATPTQTGVGAF